jgi:hypothetical protein
MGFTSRGSREDEGVLDLVGEGINVGGNGNSRMSLSSVFGREAREDLRDRLDVLLVVRNRAWAGDAGDGFVCRDEGVVPVSVSEVDTDWEAPDEPTTDSAWPVPSTTPRGTSERLIASKSSTQSSKSSSTTVVKPSASLLTRPPVGC